MKRMPCRISSALSIFLSAFTILVAFTACQKDHPNSQPAKGSLVSEVGNCYPYNIHGNFYNGVPASDTDYVEIFVKVTTPGSYKITTDQQKGVSFSASGVFTDTGLASVHLKATGLFTEHTFADFTTSFDSTHCLFRLPIHDSALLSIPDNTWEFTANGHYYHGTVFGEALLLPGGDDPTTYYGSMQGFSDTSLTLFIGYSVYDTANTCFRPTSGKVTPGNNAFYFNTSRFSTDPQVHFSADHSTDSLGAVINITTCSEVITFNGTVLDANHNVIPITNARLRCSNVTQDYFH